MTYTGKWTCSECGHTSDNEHDPCNCDDDCCTHVETIADLRTQLSTATRELAEARAAIERIRDELMAANLDVSLDDPAESLPRHVFVLRMALETRGENMDELAKERDRLTADLSAARAEAAEARARLTEREAQLDVQRNALDSACIEHVELNGILDTAREAVDYLDHEANTDGDPSGKLRDFVVALIAVIEQCEKQRRRANWYIVAYDAGRAKLVEYWQAQTAEAIAAWLDGEQAKYKAQWYENTGLPLGSVALSAHDATGRLAADIRAGKWRKEGT